MSSLQTYKFCIVPTEIGLLMCLNLLPS